MNTVRSVGYGWAVLIVAGAGSYYFAKRSINSDREERAALEEKRRQHRERLRVQEQFSRHTALSNESGGKPSVKGNKSTQDAAAEEISISQIPPSRYEAAEPWRSRKGDRFS